MPADDRTRAIERALSIPAGEELAQIKELFPDGRDGSLMMKTEIPPGLIIPLARAYTIAGLTQSKVLKKYCDNILKAQINKDRQGRIELMEALVSVRRREMEED